MYCPIKITDNKLIIPEKYDFLNDFDVTKDNVFDYLIASVWIDEWYNSEIPTPETWITDLDNPTNPPFKPPYFIRLQSLSPKCLVPQDKVDTSIIYNSPRCLESIKFMKKIGIKPLLCIRKWIDDIDDGFELRLFLWNYRLVAISKNDDKFEEISDILSIENIEKICIHFVKSINHYIPSPDCVMDVFINKNTLKITLIEFNSYGYWGQSDAAYFDWYSDANILYGNHPGIVTRI